MILQVCSLRIFVISPDLSSDSEQPLANGTATTYYSFWVIENALSFYSVLGSSLDFSKV